MIGITTSIRTLNEFCTVAVQTQATGADGSPAFSGSTDLYTNLSCRIIPLSSRRGVEQGRLMERGQFQGFFPTHTTDGLAVTFGDNASITANGVTYRPVSTLRPQFAYGGALQMCELEVKS